MDVLSLDGTWRPRTAVLGGAPLPAPVVATITLEITGDAYRATVGANADVGTLVLDPATTPAALDIHGTAGPNAGRTIPAIVARDGATLEICYELGGQGRPSAFASAPGTQRFLVTYERVAP